MLKLVAIPKGAPEVATTIRELFDFSNGCLVDKSYIGFDPELPDNILNLVGPKDDYVLTICENVPSTHCVGRQLRQPTIEESLWACGWMNMEFAMEVCNPEHPEGLRFMHEPFDGKQIVMRRDHRDNPYYMVEAFPTQALVTSPLRRVFVLV